MFIHFFLKKKKQTVLSCLAEALVRVASVFVCYSLVHVFEIRYVHFPNALALFFRGWGTSDSIATAT